MRERERGRDTGRGRSRLHAGSLMWESILGTQDHALNQRQVLSLPLAQGVILESRDRLPHQAPCMEPASPSACVSASLSVSLMNNKIKS